MSDVPFYDDLRMLMFARPGDAATLDLIDEIIRKRQDAAKRGQRLTNFIVFGRFIFDDCGNVLNFADEHGRRTPADVWPDLPIVLSGTDFNELYHTDNDEVFTASLIAGLPISRSRCDICDQGWTPHNMHTAVQMEKSFDFDMSQHVGQRVGNVLDAITHPYATFPVVKRWSVRIPGMVMAACYDAMYDYNGRRYPFSFADVDYTIIKGDELRVTGYIFRHAFCNHAATNQMVHGETLAMFKAAGYEQVVLMPTPNGYTGYASPTWFIVETEVGTLVFGRRKRVFSIDCSALPVLATDVFADELRHGSTTVTERYVHGHGIDQTVEFLGRIRYACKKHEVETTQRRS